MKEGEARKNNSFGQQLQRYDQFGQSFRLLIDEGSNTLPSKMGALCSILLLIIMMAYTSYKIYIANSKRNIDIIQAVKENHFDDSHVFSAKQGLNIAAAVYNAFDPSTYELIDPSYGSIRFIKV